MDMQDAWVVVPCGYNADETYVYIRTMDEFGIIPSD